ncbi:unnamed protein product [Phytomonas sp. EM1]|nr:unnamed protein product [Phytomonas sp. EM1]|eukprot:CCW63434.1 unnamed protein product [Phytomonas sp. isolate EM1]
MLNCHHIYNDIDVVIYAVDLLTGKGGEWIRAGVKLRHHQVRVKPSGWLRRKIERFLGRRGGGRRTSTYALFSNDYSFTCITFVVLSEHESFPFVDYLRP